MDLESEAILQGCSEVLDCSVAMDWRVPLEYPRKDLDQLPVLDCLEPDHQTDHPMGAGFEPTQT